MEKETAAARLEDALELADLAERMVRARLRREDPQASEAVIEQRLLAWLQERRGPLDGDAWGRQVPPRVRS